MNFVKKQDIIQKSKKEVKNERKFKPAYEDRTTLKIFERRGLYMREQDLDLLRIKLEVVSGILWRIC